MALCAIRANYFSCKELHYYMVMCSKSFYSALLLGANLTSNTLETLRMEGSAFKISLFLHATSNFEFLNTTLFSWSKISFQFLYENFCKENKFFKKNTKYVFWYYYLSITNLGWHFVHRWSTYLYSIKLIKYLQSLAV